MNEWIHPTTGQVMRRMEFHITYHCPEKCTFCSEEHRMQAFSAFPVTFARVATVLRLEASRGVESVHFTGGEPTIHPQFVEILQLAKKLGLRTSIGTIGTRLADERFAERAMPFLDEALFSIHGPNAEVHDPLTRRPGSFERVSRALTNARRKPGFRPFVNTVLTRHNVASLVETTRFARANDAALLVVSNLTPEGQGEDDYRDLTVSLGELAAVVPEVVHAAGPMIVRFFGVPACVLGPHRMFSNDIHWNPRVTWEWMRKPDSVSLAPIYSWNPQRKRTYVAACEGCGWKEMCAGVFQKYVDLYGDAELRAMEAA